MHSLATPTAAVVAAYRVGLRHDILSRI